jgi:hypothetical protein
MPQAKLAQKGLFEIAITQARDESVLSTAILPRDTAAELYSVHANLKPLLPSSLQPPLHLDLVAGLGQTWRTATKEKGAKAGQAVLGRLIACW